MNLPAIFIKVNEESCLLNVKEYTVESLNCVGVIYSWIVNNFHIFFHRDM